MNRAGNPRLDVLDTPKLVADALAEGFVDAARSAIGRSGRFYVALAGGTTPKAAYELLAAHPRRDAVQWEHVEIFFSDERCVPPQSADSNYRMAAAAMLDQLPLPSANVHRMHGEDDPPQAAATYAQLLMDRLGELPRLDLILLGMGTDGHTASLFPGSDPRADNELLVRAPYVAHLQSYRLTFTPLLINNAAQVIIATEGLPKAPALYAVLKGPYDPARHPVQIVAPTSGELRWIVDRAAAAELK